MKWLAVLVALIIMLVGVVGIVAPDSLMRLGQYVATPGGLYAVAAFRILVGLVLVLAAPVSRTPRILRAFGALVVLAGLATPLFGVDRTRAVLDWELAQGTALVRVGAVLALALGGFIAFVAATGRRTA